VFAPQKGATETEVDRLERGLSRLATLLGGSRAPRGPGRRAACGTACGLRAAWGATTPPGASFVAASAGLPELVRSADLVVTGEGRFDRTSLSGKVVGHLVGGARPVVVVGGQVAAPPPPGVSLTDLARDATGTKQDPQRWLREVGSLLAREVVPAHTDHPPLA
jgi:glycerate kinase